MIYSENRYHLGFPSRASWRLQRASLGVSGFASTHADAQTRAMPPSAPSSIPVVSLN